MTGKPEKIDYVLACFPDDESLWRVNHRKEWFSFNSARLEGLSTDGEFWKFAIIASQEDVSRLLGRVFDRIEYHGIEPQFQAQLQTRIRREEVDSK